MWVLSENICCGNSSFASPLLVASVQKKNQIKNKCLILKAQCLIPFLKRRFLPHKICEIRPYMLNLFRHTGPTHSLKRMIFAVSREINTSATDNK